MREFLCNVFAMIVFLALVAGGVFTLGFAGNCVHDVVMK